MAVKFSANYSKKLGLPCYSSHSFSASVEIELTDLTQVEAECQRVYSLLQQSVDKEIQKVGFVPDETYGIKPHANSNGHSHSNGRTYHANGNGHQLPRANGDNWNCTEGQKGFIQRIVNEHNLDKTTVEELANQLFNLGVKQLNKMQASQLIEELLVKTGQPARHNRWRKAQPASNGS